MRPGVNTERCFGCKPGIGGSGSLRDAVLTTCLRSNSDPDWTRTRTRPDPSRCVSSVAACWCRDADSRRSSAGLLPAPLMEQLGSPRVTCDWSARGPQGREAWGRIRLRTWNTFLITPKWWIFCNIRSDLVLIAAQNEMFQHKQVLLWWRRPFYLDCMWRKMKNLICSATNRWNFLLIKTKTSNFWKLWSSDTETFIRLDGKDHVIKLVFILGECS